MEVIRRKEDHVNNVDASDCVDMAHTDWRGSERERAGGTRERREFHQGSVHYIPRLGAPRFRDQTFRHCCQNPVRSSLGYINPRAPTNGTLDVS